MFNYWIQFDSLLSQNGAEGNDSLPYASFPETSGLLAATARPNAIKKKKTLTRPVPFDVSGKRSALLVLRGPSIRDALSFAKEIYKFQSRFGVCTFILNESWTEQNGSHELLLGCTPAAAEQYQRGTIKEDVSLLSKMNILYFRDLNSYLVKIYYTDENNNNVWLLILRCICIHILYKLGCTLYLLKLLPILLFFSGLLSILTLNNAFA